MGYYVMSDEKIKYSKAKFTEKYGVFKKSTDFVAAKLLRIFNIAMYILILLG